MCKGTSWCSQLPADPRQWSTACPLPPPDWFASAAFAFRDALEAALNHDLLAAEAALRECRSTELQDWFIDHAQNVGRFRAMRVADAAPTLALNSSVEHAVRQPESEQTSVQDRGQRYPGTLERSIFARDGWHCRYCGVPVVTEDAQRLLNQLVGPQLFPLGRRNRDRHGIRLALSANLDHVDSWSTGGSSLQDNLVTACWCCNFGKAHYSLAALGLDDPRHREPPRTTWDGGTRLQATASGP